MEVDQGSGGSQQSVAGGVKRQRCHGAARGSAVVSFEGVFRTPLSQQHVITGGAAGPLGRCRR
jgi:hypothetical protein